MKALALFLWLPLLLSGEPRAVDDRATTAPSPPPPADPRVARAVDAATMLVTRLRAALEKAIAAQGVAGAVDACATLAPTTTHALQEPGLALGRTSRHLRNPANAARPWAQTLLATLEKTPPAERGPLSTPLPGGALGVVVPIVVARPCLACHGTDVADDVRAALAARYPLDDATGYREGDLRGVVWVELK